MRRGVYGVWTGQAHIWARESARWSGRDMGGGIDYNYIKISHSSPMDAGRRTISAQYC